MRDYDEDVARFIGNLLSKITDSTEEQYEVDHDGGEALYRVIDIIQEIDEDVDIEFNADPYHFDDMSVRVRCVIIDISGAHLELIKELADIVSVIGITPTTTGELIIDINIPNVFRRAE